MKNELLSSGPAAAFLGVDKRTLRRYVRDKRLRSYSTPAGQHRFRREDLEALVDHANPESGTRATNRSSLSGLREDIERLRLEADKKLAEKRLQGIQGQERSDQQADAEAQAVARRAQAEHDRQRELQTWRSGRIQVFASGCIRAGIPPTLRAAFYRKITQDLEQFDSKQPDDVVEAVIEAAADEIFAPWEREQEKQAEAARRADETRARAAWLKEQEGEAWRKLVCAWPYTVPRDDEAVRAALDEAIVRTMQELGPDSSGSEQADAVRIAVKRVLVPYQRQHKVTQIINAVMPEVSIYLKELRKQSWLRMGPDGEETLAQLLQPKVRAHLEAEAQKRQFNEFEARQLVRDFIAQDQRII